MLGVGSKEDSEEVGERRKVRERRRRGRSEEGKWKREE